MRIPKLQVLFVLFLSLLTLSLHAQRPQGGPPGNRQGGRGNFDISKLPNVGVLSGTVIDSTTMQPLEYASVSVKHRMSDTIVTGGITNGKGKFYIDKIKLGPQVIEIAFIGYETKVLRRVRLGRETMELDLGKIYVFPSGVDLESVNVTAKRSFMTNSIDRKTYDPSQLIGSETSSASAILENIPSVEVDIDGNISLRGSQNVRILIDGRPSRLTGDDLADFLEQLPANTLDKVEVITNPSAKYEPDGMSGIINILLKKNVLKGFNGSVSAGYGGKDRVNGALNLNYRVKKINLFGNYSIRNGTYDGSGTTFRESITTDGTTFLTQESISERGRNGQFVKLGFDYFANPKTTFTLQSTLSDRGGPRYALVDTRLEDENMSSLSHYFRETDGERTGKGLNVETIFSRKFKTADNELVVNVGYSLSDNDNESDFLQQNFDLLGTPLDSTTIRSLDQSLGDRNEFDISIDYSHPINKNSKFEVGLKSTIRDSENDYHFFDLDPAIDQYVEVDLLANNFLYKEQIHAVYGTYTNKIKNFGFQLGLRAEQVFTDSKQLTLQEDFENNYFNVYPSVHLSQSLKNDQELQLSYSRRVNRPRERQLNPFIDFSDPLNLRQGNPSLLPEFVNAFELSYGKYFKSHSITASVYFRNINNSITRIKEVSANGVSLTTYENLASGNSYGFETVYVGSFGKRFTLNLSFNIFETRINGTNLASEYNNENFGYSSKLTFGSKLWKDASLQLTGRYRSGRALAQGTSEPFYVMGAAFRQSLLDRRLNLSVSTRDLFNTMQFEFTTEGTNFTQTGSRRWSSRVVFFSVSYRFGEMQRMRRNNRSRDAGNRDSGFESEGFEID
ncbi:MAG: TonB-dependent receptor [Bacteroidota bacterium]